MSQPIDPPGNSDGSPESTQNQGPPGFDEADAAEWAEGGQSEVDDAICVDGEPREQVWLEGEIEVLDERPPRSVPSRRSSGASGVVAAAMLGLGEILEPEKTEVEIVQVDDQPLEPPAIKLDFSGVPSDDREPPDNKAQL